MLYLLVGLSVLFVALSFILNEQNARYLLSGYNTLSREQQDKVDIRAYIAAFKKFHLFLGVSFLSLGLLLHYFVSPDAAGVFVAVFPICAYLYFVVIASKYMKNVSRKSSVVSVVVLVAVLLFVVALLFIGFKEDKLTATPQFIEIEGWYGERVAASDIRTIDLVEELPHIAYKSNGFALGSVSKGHFRTSEGKAVKLILNSHATPYIRIVTKDGSVIYYSGEEDNQSLYDSIRNVLPQVPPR